MNRFLLVSGAVLSLVIAPFGFVACSSSSTSNGTTTDPAADGGDGDSATTDAPAAPVREASAPGDAAPLGDAVIPPPTACPTAKYKTVVVVGDSISDVGGNGGGPAQEPFYRTLLLKNDDVLYPDWKGFDLTTCWGFTAANIVKVSQGGAVATVPTSNTPTNKGILLNQVTGLPTTLEGPVLVIGTIGGNDVTGGLISVVIGTPADVQAKIDGFVAGFGAAMAEITKVDRFGPGVQVDALMTNIYDPSGGTGHFFYTPGNATCPGFSAWPDGTATAPLLVKWNDGMQQEAAKYPGVKTVQLQAPFVAHSVSTAAASNWFYQDCIHPDTAGHNAIRGIFWAALRSL